MPYPPGTKRWVGDFVAGAGYPPDLPAHGPPDPNVPRPLGLCIWRGMGSVGGSLGSITVTWIPLPGFHLGRHGSDDHENGDL